MKNALLNDEKREVDVNTQSIETSRANNLYNRLAEYAESHKSITYSDFETHVLRDVCLFNVPDDDYMKEVEATLDMMIKALPAFKRIFARPIVRLKDQQQIIPIEAVKVIDRRSLTHVASRCELWEDITDEGIKPRKLMTLEHVETYAIYENIAFAWAVDSMLAYIKHTLVRIKDVVYGCRDIHFNLLDHTHHNLYFLAIGKLYLEYVRSRPVQENWARCVDKMMFIDKMLRLKLKSNVYLRCKRKSYNLKLKKTNIFRSHKDYAEVYKILKALEMGVTVSDMDQREICSDDEGYKAFCKLLTLFSVGHFNYTVDEKAEIDISRFDVKCAFRSWQLHIRSVNLCDIDALMLTTEKNSEYTTCVVFCEKDSISNSSFEAFKEKHRADEYLMCTPNIYGDRDQLYLSIFDIDSFRRIQQILLRGMIYSDRERTECAFCGGALKEERGVYRCDSCNAEIKEQICPETNKAFWVSDLVREGASTENKNELERRKFLHDRLEEAQLHFRNITAITSDGTPICPYCKRSHT